MADIANIVVIITTAGTLVISGLTLVIGAISKAKKRHCICNSCFGGCDYTSEKADGNEDEMAM